MEEFIKAFEAYCSVPGVKSNKAGSYAKGIRYLCEYLNISEINEDSIRRINEIKESIGDRNSVFYRELLTFLEGRNQKSYLENGFIQAALNYFFHYVNEMQSSKGIDLDSIDKRGEEQLSAKEILQHINAYIAAKGFFFDDGLVENYYLSLKSKPFVILAGTSGTGKTRLVRLFAEAIGAYGNGRYKQVAVKPDWSDSTDLFGHVNLDNKFVPGAIIDFIKKAADDPNKLPYILCLDEMNLARVEHYFSDFLSIMETRDWDEDEIVTDNLIPKTCYLGDNEAESLYADLMIPENLYIVGTVNMDETTFPFSKRVLDRANTIEFSHVDLNLPDEVLVEEANVVEVNNDFLRANYLKLRTDCVDRWETVKNINDKISSINNVLEKGDAHFGYRMRDEIIFYMLYNEEFGLLSEKEAFDNQIMQKVLPRIQGSSESTANILRELFIICAGSFTGKNGQTDGRKMESYLVEKGPADYPKSAEKICKMLRRYEDDDFTSFWV